MELPSRDVAHFFHPDEIALPRLDGRRDGLGPVVKAYLQEARARLQSWNASGASGTDVVVVFTEVVDRVVRYLWEAAVADYTRRNVRINQKCAVLAQGGYGRGELNPQSDVDLLFLYSWKVNPFVESIAEKILYSLWDTGLAVGHAVRSVQECVRLAGKDFKVKTALLDTRFLCGDESLHGEFDTAIRKDVLQKRTPEGFFKEMAGETAARRRRYGGSVYLLEPHVKEGEGGLRDLHTALWMARLKFKVQTLRELVQKSVLAEHELDEALEARDFLWRVRSTLHFLSGNHQDQLTFEYQEQVASTLGYRDADERRAVERFLRDTYLHAATIARFTDTVIERCLERPYRRFGKLFSRAIRPGLRIINGEILIEDPKILEDPVEVVSVFRESQRHGAKLSLRAKSLLAEGAPRVDAARAEPAVVAAFLDVLRGKQRIYQTLRDMHDAGVLGALAPEFGQLRCMVIRDFYHIYTVDEHTLRGIMELEHLAHGQYREMARLLTQVRHDIEKPEVLHLAMLLHDIGKGHGHGHSDRGARLARAVARRMGFHEDDVQQVELLVRHHLLMSHIAQHRDLHDDRVIVEFAKLVTSADVLKRLYVMTFADMRSVAPKVWNNWRDLLLGELYMRTLEMFEKGELTEEAREERVNRVKERLSRRVAAEAPALLASLGLALQSMPASYFLTTPEQSFLPHLALLKEFRETGVPLSTSIQHFADREFSEFTVASGDRPGLFSMIAGVLAAHGMSILGAQITTTADGVALDVFRLSHAESVERVLDDERWHRVRETLEQVLGGEVSVESLVEPSEQPSVLAKKSLPKIPTTVTFDLQDSDNYSLVEVSTQDAIGLLFAITNQLTRQGCLIHLAKISTVLHHVYDAFYVTDANGRKITDWRRMQEICESVERRLEHGHR